jgi:hypothetical protein
MVVRYVVPNESVDTLPDLDCTIDSVVDNVLVQSVPGEKLNVRQFRHSVTRLEKY